MVALVRLFRNFCLNVSFLSKRFFFRSALLAAALKLQCGESLRKSRPLDPQLRFLNEPMGAAGCGAVRRLSCFLLVVVTSADTSLATRQAFALRAVPRIFNWEEPVKRADIEALRLAAGQASAQPPSMGLRERVTSYSARIGGLKSLPEPSPRDKQVLACASGMRAERDTCGNKGPVRMRTGLEVVPCGIHDLRTLADGSHIGELPEELRFVQIIVPSVIGRARLEGRTTVSMLELGAGWAYYSLLFASMARLAGLEPINIMVEPLRRNLKAGQHNFARNGLCPPPSEMRLLPRGRAA